MSKWIRDVAVTLAAAVLVAGGLVWMVTPKAKPRVEKQKSADPEMLEAVNDWGMRCYRSIRKATPAGTNLVYFPGNNAALLGAIGMGATNVCANEIRDKTFFAAQTDPIYQKRLQRLVLRQGRDEFLLKTSVLIALGKDFQAKDDYIEAVSKTFHAHVRPLDYGGQGPAFGVNEWFKEQIGMSNLVRDEELADVRLVIATATKVKGIWEERYEPAKQHQFLLESGEKISVLAMSGSKKVRLLQRPDFDLAAIPAKGGAHLVVGIPKPLTREEKGKQEVKRKTLDEIVPLVTLDDIDELLDTHKDACSIVLPKIRISNTIDLKAHMLGMGIVDLFRRNTPTLSLGGITDENVYVSQYRQKADFMVDEGGFEGTAADVALVKGRNLNPKQFHADVPFFLAVVNPKGLIVVWAEVRDPRLVGG